jgi:hypothetical protein
MACTLATPESAIIAATLPVGGEADEHIVWWSLRRCSRRHTHRLFVIDAALEEMKTARQASRATVRATPTIAPRSLPERRMSNPFSQSRVRRLSPEHGKKAGP